MANQQAIDKILNKKFKKAAFSGYDTIDVDSFFDLVIDYLKANDSTIEEYKKQLDKVLEENKKLNQYISELNLTLSKKEKILERYESEGYGNVIINKRLNELTDEVKKIKEDKKNGK